MSFETHLQESPRDSPGLLEITTTLSYGTKDWDQEGC